MSAPDTTAYEPPTGWYQVPAEPEKIDHLRAHAEEFARRDDTQNLYAMYLIHAIDEIVTLRALVRGRPGGYGAGMAQQKGLLGQRVKVRLDETTIVEGQLVGFGEGGEAEIMCDDGMVHFCWPMLEVERAGVDGD